jgi:hypothetical protein
VTLKSLCDRLFDRLSILYCISTCSGMLLATSVSSTCTDCNCIIHLKTLHSDSINIRVQNVVFMNSHRRRHRSHCKSFSVGSKFVYSNRWRIGSYSARYLLHLRFNTYKSSMEHLCQYRGIHQVVSSRETSKRRFGKELQSRATKSVYSKRYSTKIICFISGNICQSPRRSVVVQRMPFRTPIKFREKKPTPPFTHRIHH